MKMRNKCSLTTYLVLLYFFVYDDFQCDSNSMAPFNFNMVTGTNDGCCMHKQKNKIIKALQNVKREHVDTEKKTSNRKSTPHFTSNQIKEIIFSKRSFDAK